jgi:hypothetical protein
MNDSRGSRGDTVEASLIDIRKLQHSVTKDIYYMRFGPAARRFVRDGEPLDSIFTNHGRPRQVSVAYPVAASDMSLPEAITWDPDMYRPDWAYAQRALLVELD